MPESRPPSPAVRCLRAVQHNLRLFLAAIGSGIAIAAAVTAAQPTLYRSQALLSVKPPPEIVAEAVRTKRPYLTPDGHIYDANDPERQTGPGKYAPRLTAAGLVTAAAHAAGILPPDSALDDAQAARWVRAERIEGADLIRLDVWQPTADAAQKLAEAIVSRGMDINHRDEAAVPAPELRRVLTIVDPPTRPAAPAYPRWPVNLSVGFAFGVLVASALVAVREA